MPAPLLRSAPGVRRAGVLVVAALLTGCTADPQRPPGTAPTSTGADQAPSSAAVPSSAVAEVLDRRDTALRTGDEAAFLTTVADPGSADGRDQLAAFRAARALRATVTHDDGPTPDPLDQDPAAVTVGLRYRVGGVDRGDRTATVRYTVLARTGGAVVVSQAGGSGAAPPWLAMPMLDVRRTARAVVAGTAGAAVLDEAARTVDRVLPSLDAPWPGTPQRALVLVPATVDEAGIILGRPAGGLAATTDGPQGPDGRATGDRVVLDPQARQRLSATGREVVLAHELVHVAVRATVPGAAPTWLDEGYADHVAYARADLPQRRLAAALVTAVRDGTGPGALPTAAQLDPANGDVEVGYLAAWQAAETVVALAGEDALVDLVRRCRGTDGPVAAEQVCESVLPQVVGTDRAGLTRAWRARLADLAR